MILWFCFTLVSCDKQNDWLQAKRQKNMVVPENFKDYQALLDDFYNIHNAFPIFGLVGADDILLTDIDYKNCAEDIRNGYIWNKEIWSTDNSTQWQDPFEAIIKSNIVIEGLSKITRNSANETTHDDILGQAYFYRSIFYYNLAQLFCKPYSDDAEMSLGLPLRKSSDVNLIEQRSTLQQTYDFIIHDALIAEEKLPQTSVNNRRPSKAAVHALLAKVYLTMGNYEKAFNYSNETIKSHHLLLDFNSNYASLATTFRFPRDPLDHPEIIFYSRGPGFQSVMPAPSTSGIVNPELLSLYDDDDLRKNLFFFTTSENQVKYRGSYTGTNINFCGLATNEIYLIRAESSVRLGRIKEGITDLNNLLKHRYTTGHFIPIETNDIELALEIVLKERRKELVGVSNIRWEDLRRLNKENKFQKTLTRVVNGQRYTLEPNSKRYVMPIPGNEIQLSNIIQNER